MSQSRTSTRRRPADEAHAPGRGRRESASTADGLVAQREALAERERRTAQAMTAARRLNHPPEPRP
jgi:hypothetical protein